MIVRIFDRNVFKLLTVFAASPGSKFQRKELKEKTRLNNVNLDDALNSLMASNLLMREKRLFYLNLEAAGDVQKIVAGEYKKLNGLPFDVYFSILDVLFLLGRSNKCDLYLFGSYAKLVFRQDSDIDLAIISEELTKKEKDKVARTVQKAESRYGKKMEIHYFGRDFYKNKADPLVAEILRNSVKLL